MGKRKKLTAQDKRDILEKNLNFYNEKIKINENSLFFGVDGSIQRPGFCLLDSKGGVVEMFHLKTKGANDKKRLIEIGNVFENVIKEYPEIALVAFEDVVVRKFFTAMKKLAMVYGACLSRCPTYHIGFTPTQLKKSATGNGKAEKEDVMRVLEEKFGLTFKTDDESDAYCAARLAYLLSFYNQIFQESDSTMDFLKFKDSYSMTSFEFEALSVTLQSKSFYDQNH